MSEIKIVTSEYYKFKINPTPGKCNVVGCRGRSRKGRAMCSKHIMQLWRARNPSRAAFNTLRDHAKQRHIPFEMTFDEFMDLIAKSGYAQGKGCSNGMLQIDRRDACGAYSYSNCRVMEASENIIKGNRERRALSYRISLFRRLGYKEEADNLQEQLRELEGLQWVDPADDVPSNYQPTANAPF